MAPRVAARVAVRAVAVMAVVARVGVRRRRRGGGGEGAGGGRVVTAVVTEAVAGWR